MKNILYMDCIATTCSVYKGEHMEHLEEQDNDGGEEDVNEENKGVELRRRATILVRVMSDSWFGIGSMVFVCQHDL